MTYFENFISYRRAYTSELAQKLHDKLRDFGRTVFWDNDSIHAGKFDEKISQAIEHCQNFIVLTSYDSLMRCSDKDDWVRKEITQAIELRKNIVVLFAGEDFRFPEDLPEELEEIKRYNGIPYFDVNNNRHVDRLVNEFLGYEHTVSQDDDFVVEKGVLVEYRGSAQIVIIPENVVAIANEAFSDRTDIKEVHFSSSVKTIGKKSFERCRLVEVITLPENLSSIGEGSFRRCTELHAVKLNPNLKSIGQNAFEFCTALQQIEIGPYVERIDPSAFNNCPNLKMILVDPLNPLFASVDGVLYTKDRSIIVRCPEGKEELSLPHSVNTIGKYAFYKSSLETLLITEAIIRIEAFAFQQCKLRSINYHGAQPETNPTAFTGCSRLKNNPFEVERNENVVTEGNRDIKKYLLLYEYVIVVTTFESEEEAKNMTAMLLENKLIVAGQLRHFRSIYSWDDQICDEEEIELSCITEGRLYDQLEKYIAENHSYEEPQIYCTPIINTTNGYGNWITGFVS